MLTFVDRDAFAMYCQLVAEFREAVRAQDTNKQIKLTQQTRIMAAEFGLTPASRSGIVVKGKVKDSPKEGAEALF